MLRPHLPDRVGRKSVVRLLFYYQQKCAFELLIYSRIYYLYLLVLWKKLALLPKMHCQPLLETYLILYVFLMIFMEGVPAFDIPIEGGETVRIISCRVVHIGQLNGKELIKNASFTNVGQ